jgi:hypothetical protein
MAYVGQCQLRTTSPDVSQRAIRGSGNAIRRSRKHSQVRVFVRYYSISFWSPAAEVLTEHYKAVGS